MDPSWDIPARMGDPARNCWMSSGSNMVKHGPTRSTDIMCNSLRTGVSTERSSHGGGHSLQINAETQWRWYMVLPRGILTSTNECLCNKTGFNLEVDFFFCQSYHEWISKGLGYGSVSAKQCSRPSVIPINWLIGIRRMDYDDPQSSIYWVGYPLVMSK